MIEASSSIFAWRVFLAVTRFLHASQIAVTVSQFSSISLTSPPSLSSPPMMAVKDLRTASSSFPSMAILE